MGLGGRLGSIWQSGGPACGAWMRNQPITPDKLLMARRPRSRPTLVSGTMRKCVVFAPPLLDRSTGQHTALGATGGSPNIGDTSRKVSQLPESGGYADAAGLPSTRQAL